MIMEEEDWTTFYILYADYQYGYIHRDLFPIAIEPRGGAVVGSDPVPVGTVEWGPFLIKAFASGADAIFCGSAGADEINAVKGWEAYGLKEKMGFMTTVTDPSWAISMGSEAAEGAYFCMPFYWEIDEPGVKAFNDEIMARHGHVAEGYAFYAYTHIKLLGAALDGADSFSAEDVRDYIFANPEVELPTGPAMVVDYLHGFAPTFYLLRGKEPGEITGEWDVFKVVDSRPGSSEFLRTPEELGY